MDFFETATGKRYDTDYFNPCAALGLLNIRVLGKSLPELAGVFYDNPAETGTLTYAETEVEGYTRLKVISPEGDAVRVVLEKEVTV